MNGLNVNPAWCAIFLSFSAFNNAGFSIFSDNFISIQTHSVTLIFCALLVMLGNVAFPVVLRFIIYVVHHFKETRQPRDLQVYKYILKNPRRVFTHLFPPKETKFLAFIIVATLFVEMTAFLALEWNANILSSMNSFQKLTVAFFQSASTRTAGFNAVDLRQVNVSLWVLYVGLMYLSVYPVAVVLKESNVSEIFVQEAELQKNKVRKISQKILLQDISWLYVGFLLICYFEATKIEKNDPDFTIFRVLFELVSAYGTGNNKFERDSLIYLQNYLKFYSWINSWISWT